MLMKILISVFQGVEEIGSAERDLVVRWLAQLTRQFTFYPETFALSVAILDRFLHVVKVCITHSVITIENRLERG